MKRLMMISTALIFSATLASAAVSTSDLVAAFQAQGYTKIEVTSGVTQIKVEAVNGTQKIEVIYDAETGAILAQHSQHSAKHDQGQGVVVSTENHDFLNDGSNGHDSDHAVKNENEGHDDSATGDGDDNGSDHADGSHDHGNDDHGNDKSDHKDKSDKD